ncbi:MAG TPA: insulinase family protein [Polyangiaceae bacterium]
MAVCPALARAQSRGQGSESETHTATDSDEVRRWLAELPKPEQHRLENGLRVVLQPTAPRGQVALVVSYRIGLADDPPGLHQLSHLIEHLTFRGSRHLQDLEIHRVLERAGASNYNGATDDRVTRYYATAPPSALPALLWVESERMAFTLEKLSQRSLDVERRVVEKELLRFVRDRYEPLQTASRFVLGEDHPYAPPVDPVAGLREIRLEHVQSVFQTYYRPDNAVLLLVGDFRTAAAKAQIHKYFAPIVAPRKSLTRVAAPRAAGFDRYRKIVVTSRPLEQRVARVWRGPRPGGVQGIMMRLALRSLAAKVRVELRKRYPLVDTNAGLFGPVETRLYAVGVTLTKGLDHATVDETIDRALGHLPARDWGKVLPGTKRQNRISLLQGIEQPLKWAVRHDSELLYERRLFDPVAWLAELDALEPSDMERFVARLLRCRSVSIYVKDAEPSQSVPEEGLVELTAR